MTTGGPVGYLLTDIDGSVAKWEKDPAAMTAAMARHDALVEAIVAQFGGQILERAGDGVFARFETPNAIGCALELQGAMRLQSWDEVGGLSVRIGLHAAFEPNGERDRLAVNRAARMRDAAWGGQVIISSRAVASFGAPSNAILTDLGDVLLRGIDEPQRLFSATLEAYANEEFPPLRDVVRQSPSLPAQSTPIFGREVELQEIAAMFKGGHRWITITGAGGAGKTRLALEFARAAAKSREVHLVQLEPGTCDEDALVRAIAAALRLPSRDGEASDTLLVNYLADKSPLLIIDNADGVGDGAVVIGKILDAAPNTLVLMTRREPVARVGERPFKLGGLSASSDDENWRIAPAAMLFVQSARGLDPKFDLLVNDRRPFGAICEAVRGSPLALHLVAQWVNVLQLDEIAEQLAQGDAGFLSKLDEAGGGSLRAVFEGSWSLLTSEQKRVLAGLAIFPATFDVPAVEAIVEAPGGVVQALERKSLLERRSAHRFGLHPLVREFAAEKLSEWTIEDQSALSTRHSAYYRRRLDDDFGATLGPGQPMVAARARAELANVSAAWASIAALEDGEEISASAERHFYIYAIAGMYAEALSIFARRPRTLRLAATFAALRANCLAQLGRYHECRLAADEAFRLAAPDQMSVLAHVEHVLGNAFHGGGELSKAEPRYRAALALRRNDALGSFYSHLSLAWLHLHGRAPQQAYPFLKAADRLQDELSFMGGALSVRVCSGELAAAEGRFEDAAEHFRSATALEYAFDNLHHRAMLRIRHGRALLRLDNSSGEGLVLVGEGLAMARQAVQERACILALVLLAQAPNVSPEDALVRLGEALWRAMERLRAPFEKAMVIGAIALVEAKRGKVQRANELVDVARGLKLELEEQSDLTALGVASRPNPVTIAGEAALTALVAEYKAFSQT